MAHPAAADRRHWPTVAADVAVDGGPIDGGAGVCSGRPAPGEPPPPPPPPSAAQRVGEFPRRTGSPAEPRIRGEPVEGPGLKTALRSWRCLGT